MKATTARIIWWQFMVLITGTSAITAGVTTRIVEKQTQRIVEEEMIDPAPSILALSSTVTELREEVVRALGEIPEVTVPDHNLRLESLARAIREIPVPEPCDCPDYTAEFKELSRTFHTLMREMEQTIIALPDSHVVNLRVRREGDAKFILRVSEGRVRWSRDD
ncbi:MAG: hypothetical protein AMS18_07100 [Gemmatimonas sp. SG8_17]|nr:MAG: hypothetical protein AMS18_07100 [Gemmatimonas sp. SG8_17]